VKRSAIHSAASAGPTPRTSMTRSIGPMGLESQTKHFTVLLLTRMPTEAVRSPFWCRSGCQQWTLPKPSNRRSSARATSAIGNSRLMYFISGMPSLRAMLVVPAYPYDRFVEATISGLNG
jgi:hypothetical protein